MMSYGNSSAFKKKLDVVIGFDPAEYMIREDGGEVAFMVRLINGTLTKPVVVEFFTTDGTAGGEITNTKKVHDIVHCT